MEHNEIAMQMHSHLSGVLANLSTGLTDAERTFVEDVWERANNALRFNNAFSGVVEMTMLVGYLHNVENEDVRAAATTTAHDLRMLAGHVG